ncbi:MAG: metal ABC transporter permease [Planctomycetes bacterium]|nr:metal ABC transporter permease [Planctomycetota bacterium]MCW8135530.1 metal ABC transporter permease [Planctomycetota bacterium]
MPDVILGYFTDGWQATILACVVLACLSSGVLSPIVVSSRMAFFSDAVAHSTLAGVALGMLLGFGSPTTTMIGFAVVVALLIATLRQYTTLSLDSLLGVAMAGSLAVGVLLYHRTKGYSDLHGYLFGAVSLLGTQDLVILAANAVLALVMVGLFANRFLLLAVSRPLAQARGVPVARYEYLLIVVLGLVVAVGVRAVGLLMVNALLIVPAATSRNVTRTVAGMFWGSVLVALASGLIGLFGAGWLGLTEGPSIVVVAVVLFIVSQALRPLFGHQVAEA